MTLHNQKFHDALKFFFPLCALCLLMMQPENVFSSEADRNVVLTMGESQINKDIPTARSAAVEECLAFAVQNTAVGMIPVAFLTEKFDRIADLLSRQNDEFITDYKVLKEITTDKHYRVLVQVTISTVKLKEALTSAGLVPGTAKLPKILFLIAEQPADAISPHYWWRAEKLFFQTEAAVSAMETILAEKGFPLIDEAMIPPGIYKDLGLNAKLTDDQALDLGRRVQAEVIILGDAVARETSNRMGESARTFEATVTARGISVETGEEIARTMNTETSVSQDAAAGSRQSLSGAGGQAATALAGQILSKWQQQVENKEQITIRIQGADILPYLVLFRNTLGKIDGVTRLQTLEMTPNAAVVQVQFDGGTPQDLADALLLKTFDTFGINIYEVSGTTLSIELVAK